MVITSKEHLHQQEFVSTPLIQKAAEFAFKVHQEDQHQIRKGNGELFINHLYRVAGRLAEVTQDEDIVIAGLLHDVIEDCKPYGSITQETLAQEFNPRIAGMVQDVTENKDLTWQQRKQAAIDHIAHLSPGSQLLKSSDVFDNLNDLCHDYQQKGEEIWQVFGASKPEVIWYYTQSADMLIQHLPNNPFAERLQEKVDLLLDLSQK